MKFKKTDTLKNMKIKMIFTNETIYNESLFYTIKSLKDKRKINHVIHISHVMNWKKNELNNRITKSFLLFDTFSLKKHNRDLLNEIRGNCVFDVSKIITDFLVNNVALKVCGL